jgi:hypothetical protein
VPRFGRPVRLTRAPALAGLLALLSVAACGGGTDPAQQDPPDAAPADATTDSAGDGRPVDLRDTGADVSPETAPTDLADSDTPALADIVAITFGSSAAGDLPTFEDIRVDLRVWSVTLTDHTSAPPARFLDAAQKQEVLAFLTTPGVLATLTATEPCGQRWADFNEFVKVDVDGRPGERKEITYCAQAPFVRLRTLWQALRNHHFCAGKPNNEAPFICLRGTPGGPCTDVGPPPICEAGRQVCPHVDNAPPLVPSNQCACTGCPGPDAGRSDGSGGPG